MRNLTKNDTYPYHYWIPSGLRVMHDRRIGQKSGKTMGLKLMDAVGCGIFFFTEALVPVPSVPTADIWSCDSSGESIRVEFLLHCPTSLNKWKWKHPKCRGENWGHSKPKWIPALHIRIREVLCTLNVPWAIYVLSLILTPYLFEYPYGRSIRVRVLALYSLYNLQM